jgi:lysozyme
VVHEPQATDKERNVDTDHGHTGPGTQSMGKITHARGLELPAADLAIAESAVNGLKLELTQPQFDALVSIAFNCGGGIVAPSTALGEALRAPEMAGVPAALRLYTHAGNKELPGLIRRRSAEAEMWGKPAAATGPATWLTPVELRRCREFDELRKAATRTAEQERRMPVLVRVLTAQRKRIWHAAQASPRGDGNGWDFRDRRQRYRSLLSRTRPARLLARAAERRRRRAPAGERGGRDAVGQRRPTGNRASRQGRRAPVT